jgi:hypothetical protein
VGCANIVAFTDPDSDTLFRRKNTEVNGHVMAVTQAIKK